MSIRPHYLLVVLLLSGMLGYSQTLTDGPTVATNADGRLELFARGSDGAVWHNSQTTPGGAWGGWLSLGGWIVGSPRAIVNWDGRLEVFVLGGGNTIYHNWQTSPGGGWSGWFSIGCCLIAPPTVAMNFDGRLEIFAPGTDTAVFHSSQGFPGGPWTVWTSLGGSVVTSPSVAMNADGRLEIFGLKGNTVSHAWQNVPGGQWSGWGSFPGSLASTPTTAVNNDGRVEIFAQGTDGAGWHLWQMSPNGAAGWSSWSSLGGGITGSPMADLDGSGNLNAFAISPGGPPWMDTQASGWAGWSYLGGSIIGTPSIGMNFDGRQEIFGLTGAGVYHNWQLTPAGPWSGWSLLTSPSNARDTNGADVPYYLTDVQNDANYASEIADPNSIAPTWFSTLTTWPCGARVNIKVHDFKTKDLKWAEKAKTNWNKEILKYYSKTYSTGAVPVQFYISAGGPQEVDVHTTCDTCIKSDDPKHPNSYARAVTGSWKEDTTGRLSFAETQIVEGMHNPPALTNTLAHELGHTFGLTDCYQCGRIVNDNNFPYEAIGYTVMDSYEPAPAGHGWDDVAKNFPEALAGPNDKDMSVIDSNVPDFKSCIAESAIPPDVPACTNGTSVGFMDTGGTGQYTCNNTACDGCNPGCNNFAPQHCSGGGSSGQSCTNWCGNLCMDNATCSCPGESPSCVENSGGWFPSCNNSCSPIIIDSFDEGFHLTDMSHGVKFRVTPDGPLVQMGWSDPAFRNGWLALDRNGNGIIDDFTELFGNMTPQGPSNDPNGYLALAGFDDPMNGGNGNGVIDPGDSVYDQLRLWIDANHNGISEPEELHTLREMGVFRIDFKYHLSKYVDANGNSFRYKSRIWDEAGHGRDVCYDVFLSMQALLPGSN